MAVNAKLTEHVKQMSARMPELNVEVENGKETVADLNVKLKAPGKCAEDIVI